MKKKTCNKRNTRNKSNIHKDQNPPTTDIDSKEKQATETAKRGRGGRIEDDTRSD